MKSSEGQCGLQLGHAVLCEFTYAFQSSEGWFHHGLFANVRKWNLSWGTTAAQQASTDRRSSLSFLSSYFSAGGLQQRPVYSAATCLRCCPAVTPPVEEGLVWTSAEASGVSAFTAASALLVVLSPDCPKLPLLSPVAASVGAPADGKRQRCDAARSVRTAGYVAQIGCALPASNGNDSGNVGK